MFNLDNIGVFEDYLNIRIFYEFILLGYCNSYSSIYV